MFGLAGKQDEGKRVRTTGVHEEGEENGKRKMRGTCFGPNLFEF